MSSTSPLTLPYNSDSQVLTITTPIKINHYIPTLGIITYHIHASKFYQDKSSHPIQYPSLNVMNTIYTHYTTHG